MNYCVECGTKLEEKYLEMEGMIPFCPSCNQFRFSIFNSATSMIVMNEERNKILLIKQYGGTDYILVAGYINKGENAEETVVREVMEEIGLHVTDIEFNKSQYFDKSNTLMLNFICTVDSESLDDVTKEVDHAEWFSIEEAREKIKQNSLAQEFLEYGIQTKICRM